MTFLRHDPSKSRSGAVLIAVLIVIVLLTLVAFQFSELMLQEYAAANSSMKAVQARACADSGIYVAAAMLADKDTLKGTLGNNPYDSESQFGNVLVHDDSERTITGRFSIVAAIDRDSISTSRTFRYGVVDEAGKINLNALLRIDTTGQVAHDMLMKLPNMTEEIADAIIDWIDADDTARANGAESEYYQALIPPYRCKNGPLDSLEELLLVRGVTPRLLFGTDKNRNGVEDSGEDDGNGWDPGWGAYLTVYSRERNIDNDGNARTFLNDTDLKKLHDALVTAVGQPLADFIILYRTQTNSPAAPASPTPSSGGSAPIQMTLQLGGQSGGGGLAIVVAAAPAAPAAPPTVNANAQQVTDKLNQVLQGTSNTQLRSIASRYELIGASVTWTVGMGRTQQTLRMNSPLTAQSQATLLPPLVDKTTTQRDMELPARINVLTASRSVLTTLPGLTEADVQSIADVRPDYASATGDQDAVFQTPAWLLLNAGLTPAKMTALERYVTSRTQVYRVQSIGYFDQGGPTSRVEAINDTNGGKPRILMWRDLSDLGKGYDLSK